MAYINKFICAECGTSFQGRNPNCKYCSKKCMKIGERRRENQRRQLEREKNIRTVKCLKCGKVFNTYLSVKKYCSVICREAYHDKNRDKKRIRRLTCFTCEKKFSSRYKDKKYCSSICKKISAKQRKRNENKNYSSSHKALLSEDMIKCERCGYDQYPVLERHHKDVDRNNNKRENLEVLCPTCHKVKHYLLRDALSA